MKTLLQNLPLRVKLSDDFLFYQNYLVLGQFCHQIRELLAESKA